MKKHLLLSIFMLPVYLTAQSVHDLKADVIGLFDRNYQLYYEWIPQQRIGVEVELQYLGAHTLFLTFFFLLSSPAQAVIEITGSGHPSGPGACDGFIDVPAEGSAGPFRLEISGPGEYSDLVEGIDGGYTFEGLCSGAAYDITPLCFVYSGIRRLNPAL